MIDDVLINVGPIAYTPPVGGTTFGAWATLATPPIPLRGLWIYPNNYNGNILINLGLGSSPASIYVENIQNDSQGQAPIWVPMFFPANVPISFQGIQYNGTAGFEISATLVGGDISLAHTGMQSLGQSVNNAFYGFQPPASTAWQQIGSGLLLPSREFVFGLGSGTTGAYNGCSIGYGPNTTSVTTLIQPSFGDVNAWQYGYVNFRKKLPSGTLLWLYNNDNGNIVVSGYAFY